MRRSFNCFLNPFLGKAPKKKRRRLEFGSLLTQICAYPLVAKTKQSSMVLQSKSKMSELFHTKDRWVSAAAASDSP